MLRKMFGLPSRVDVGLIKSVNQSIMEYVRQLREITQPTAELAMKISRWEITAGGFMVSLNELEQSKFAGGQYRKMIHDSFMEEADQLEMNNNEMDNEELDHYRLHMYFYKNAFVRVFSILDKLGYFMNDQFELYTQQEKTNFSYFTVLRQMHKNNVHPELEQKLYNLKENYQAPLNQLRTMRNMEIHSGNIEVQDDLLLNKHAFSERVQDENLQVRMQYLESSYEMVCLTLLAVFTYSKRHQNDLIGPS